MQPADDPRAGLTDYADSVVRAIGARSNIVLVAQSLGGFTAPLVCARTSVRTLILVNAMIPNPHETAGAWWQNTRASESRVTAAQSRGYSTTFDVPTYFLHDVPQAVLRTGSARQRDQAESIFEEPCRFERWPGIPIHVIRGPSGRTSTSRRAGRRIAPARARNTMRAPVAV